MKRSKKLTQTSETFLLSSILALSGGFQDAYTYNVRDKVFSNAQTGNVVLMSQHFMEGDWLKGVHYVFPVLAFALGVLVAERIGHRYKNSKKIHWRQIVVILEILILLSVGLIDYKYNMPANMLVSFSCAMQVQTFRKVNGYGYASTMCIGNLRSGTESLSVFIREHQFGALEKAMHYWYNYYICNRCRCGRNLLKNNRDKINMDIMHSAAWCMPYDDKRAQIIKL